MTNSPANQIKWVLPYLSGFICTYHPAAMGSSPKPTIYAQICAIFVMWKEPKWTKKRPDPFLKIKSNEIME